MKQKFEALEGNLREMKAAYSAEIAADNRRKQAAVIDDLQRQVKKVEDDHSMLQSYAGEGIPYDKAIALRNQKEELERDISNLKVSPEEQIAICKHLRARIKDIYYDKKVVDETQRELDRLISLSPYNLSQAVESYSRDSFFSRESRDSSSFGSSSSYSFNI
jgi:alpha-L-fucosidase